MRTPIFCLFVLLPTISGAQTPSGVPVFGLQEGSSVKFDVKPSVSIAGTFDKWKATVTFTSPDYDAAVLHVNIQADSVNTGIGMKDGELKGKDFFDVQESPLIMFHSTKVVQTGSNAVDFDGDFTIRGVTKPEKLTFTITGKVTGEGTVAGTMAFDRKDFGMNKGIPFIKIADRVAVTVDLRAKRVSGSPIVFKE